MNNQEEKYVDLIADKTNCKYYLIRTSPTSSKWTYKIDEKFNNVDKAISKLLDTCAMDYTKYRYIEIAYLPETYEVGDKVHTFDYEYSDRYIFYRKCHNMKPYSFDLYYLFFSDSKLYKYKIKEYDNFDLDLPMSIPPNLVLLSDHNREQYKKLIWLMYHSKKELKLAHDNKFIPFMFYTKKSTYVRKLYFKNFLIT